MQRQDSVYGLFAEAAGKYPNSPAVRDSCQTVTFRELAVLADRMAGGFPVRPQAVGIVMSHCALMIAAMLAVLKSGALYVPAELSFPQERIRFMMREAGVDFVITECHQDALSEFRMMRPDPAVSAASRIPAGSSGPYEAAREDAADAPAYVLYTSGTTGRPKGVSVSNANVCHYIRAFAQMFHPVPGDCMLQYSVCSFDIFVEEVFASLCSGACLAIPDEHDRQDIRSLMNFVERERVTMISGFPYLLAEMNRLPKIPASVRLLISGGDVLRGSYVDRLLTQTEVYNTYGPSETTVSTTCYRCRDGGLLADGTYPLGRPLPGTQIRILDKRGREVPQGSSGEICIYGDGVSQGYIGDREAENRAFEILPDGSRMYRSGDLGYVLPDGNIAFLHRLDTQVMIRGRRVEVMEVESALCRCPGVDQAVVRAFTDEAGLAYITAYVVSADPKFKVSALRQELSRFLADFMLPEFIVKMPRIPLNSNGKPDTRRLPVVMKEC